MKEEGVAWCAADGRQCVRSGAVQRCWPTTECSPLVSGAQSALRQRVASSEPTGPKQMDPRMRREQGAAWCAADGHRQCVRSGRDVRCWPSSQCRHRDANARNAGPRDARVQPTDENGLFADTDYFIQLFSARRDVCTHRWLSVDSCSASAPSLSADPGKGRPDSGRWRLSRAVAGSSTYYIRPASCPQVDLAFDATCSRPLLSDRADPLAAGRASSQAQAIGKLKASRSASRAAWSFEPAGKYGRFRVTARSCGHKLLSPAPVGWPGASCEAGPMLLVDRENATLGHQLLGTLRLIKVVRVRVRVRVRFRVRRARAPRR